MSLIKCDTSVVQLVKPSTAKRHKSIETTMKAAENHSIVDAATLLRCGALGDAPDDARWLQAGASLAVRPPATSPPRHFDTRGTNSNLYQTNCRVIDPAQCRTTNCPNSWAEVQG